MRFDVALHELRLFRSRSQAAAAISEGLALLNGHETKASHIVAPGDRITIEERGRRRTVEVLELPRRSLSREAARALVRDVATG